jgi:16S rRNA (cytidine1402-2'-O)-methyltransferase
VGGTGAVGKKRMAKGGWQEAVGRKSAGRKSAGEGLVGVSALASSNVRHPEPTAKDPLPSSTFAANVERARDASAESPQHDGRLSGLGLADSPLSPGLYVVATPIGNLEDITLRGLRVLRQADIIACEDTRQTQKLLNHFSIATPKISYHEHNEAGRAAQLIERLRAGERVALVSDAGTPGISDPGATLICAALAAGISVTPVPGANAALTALVASGVDTESFVFLGFLPPRGGERRSFLEGLRGERRTMIFYESPHRIAESFADVAAAIGPARRIVLARELTKVHEEFLRGTVAEVQAQVAARENLRGEMVLLIAGASASAETVSSQSLAQRVRQLMSEEQLDEKSALKRAAKERGLGKSEAYREWQRRKE